jgi:hypothetical protein
MKLLTIRFLLSLILFFLISTLTFAQEEEEQADKRTTSSAEIAKELANPNTSLGTLAFQFDYINYQGELQDANRQNGFTLNFQPAFPVPLGKGTNLFVRPLIPVYFTQPIYGANGFENAGFNLGNISADVAVGKTWPSKTITIIGVFGSFRTATDKTLKSDFTMLGPEFMVAKLYSWGAVGAMVNHSWSLNAINSDADSFTILADNMWASSVGEQKASITAGQYFYVLNLKNAWQITGQPTWSYNHNAAKGNRFIFPIGTGFNKVALFGKLPIKLSLQYWYYVASPDTFGPQHQLRLSISPVVPLPW